METLHRLVSQARWGSLFTKHDFDPFHTLSVLISVTFTVLLIYLVVHSVPSFAGVTHLPGEDASDKLEAAGTLLKVLDTAIFKWGARILAGVCIMSSAWALKEQRFGIAVICVVGAIIFGTASKWVKNIFDVGDNQSLFSQSEKLLEPMRA
jgi:hypothetical protein